MTLSPPWCAPSHLCAHLDALSARSQTLTALLTPASQTFITATGGLLCRSLVQCHLRSMSCN